MQGADDKSEAAVPASALGQAVGWLTWVGGALATALVVVILALIAYAVTLRYVFGIPLTWADDLSSYLLVAFVSLGAAEALRRNEHIAIDMIAHGRGTASRVIALWSDLAVLAFAAVLAWSAWGQLRFAYDFGSFSNDQLELPIWITFVPLVVGAALLAVTALARLIDLLTQQGRA